MEHRRELPVEERQRYAEVRVIIPMKRPHHGRCKGPGLSKALVPLIGVSTGVQAQGDHREQRTITS